MQEIVTKTMDTHHELFNEMLERFNLSAREVGEAAGISEVTLSRFRRGKADLLTSKFLHILNVIPEEAKDWYLSQLLGSQPTIGWRKIIKTASTTEKVEMLSLIANSFTESLEADDFNCLPSAV
jgi:transcriptional regulator with XRE-family HTH domain